MTFVKSGLLFVASYYFLSIASGVLQAAALPIFSTLQDIFALIFAGAMTILYLRHKARTSTLNLTSRAAIGLSVLLATLPVLVPVCFLCLIILYTLAIGNTHLLLDQLRLTLTPSYLLWLLIYRVTTGIALFFSTRYYLLRIRTEARY